MARRILAAALLLLLGPARGAVAGPPNWPKGPPVPPDPLPLVVTVMTFGPGDHPFLKFGHDAIWIHDPRAGTDRVYNFGTFRFDSPRLILDFLGGRMMYWLSVSTLPAVLAEYEHENRDILVQRLDLDPSEASTLQQMLDENARPRNRAYRYDYFLDNCSTRVRDALDRAGVSIRAYGHEPGRLTLRGHALRMAADSLPLYLALDLVLGPRVDQPTDRWAEMFLPQELARALRVAPAKHRGAFASWTLHPGDGDPRDEARSMGDLPVVASEEVVFRANRAPPREAPPDWRSRFGAAGVGLGLLMLALGWRAATRRWARVGFGIALAGWGLVVGFIGCFLVYVWGFTDHVVAHRNQNILLCAPWAIALAALGVGLAAGWPRARTAAFWVVVTAAFTATCGALFHLLRLGTWQGNGDLAAFFLPVWLGAAAALGRLQLLVRAP